MAQVKRQYDLLRAKDVSASVFDVELWFDVPEGYWGPDLEVPYHHPEQRYFWRRAIPKEQPEDWRDDWLDRLHTALMGRGWPRENIDALYSYVDRPLWNPDQGEEPDPERHPLGVFDVRIPGDWLVDHPDFFKDLAKLQRKGLVVQVNGKKERFYLDSYRIYANDGELNGADWENTFFLVRPPREKPPAHEGGPRDWFPEEPLIS